MLNVCGLAGGAEIHPEGQPDNEDFKPEEADHRPCPGKKKAKTDAKHQTGQHQHEDLESAAAEAAMGPKNNALNRGVSGAVTGLGRLVLQLI